MTDFLIIAEHLGYPRFFVVFSVMMFVIFFFAMTLSIDLTNEFEYLYGIFCFSLKTRLHKIVFPYYLFNVNSSFFSIQKIISTYDICYFRNMYFTGIWYYKILKRFTVIIVVKEWSLSIPVHVMQTQKIENVDRYWIKISSFVYLISSIRRFPTNSYLVC